MTIFTTKVVDTVTYASGTGQYIVLPVSHRTGNARFIQLHKESGSGTLDVHPLEFSCDGVNYSTTFSADASTEITPISEATGITTKLWSISEASFPYTRLKIDVNTDSVVVSVVVVDRS